MPDNVKTETPPDRQTEEDRKKKSTPPAAGPHAKPSLTDESKTPGSGTLPDPDRPNDGDATSG